MNKNYCQHNLQHDPNPALLTFQSLEFRIYDLSLVQNMTHDMHSKLLHATQRWETQDRNQCYLCVMTCHGSAYQHLIFTNQRNNITLRNAKLCVIF